MPRVRGGGRYTEAGFWGFIRSALRSASRRWKPTYDVLLRSRRTSKSENVRLKWEYQCAECSKWVPQKQIKVDHIIPAGSLRCAEDLPGFVERLFCETDGMQLLCEDCHAQKTEQERRAGLYDVSSIETTRGVQLPKGKADGTIREVPTMSGGEVPTMETSKPREGKT